MKKIINSSFSKKVLPGIFTMIALWVSIINPTASFGQSSNQNYSTTTVTRVSGLVDDATLQAASADKSKVQTTITYVDGLGRPIQTIQRQASPLGYDMVTPITYDAYGRELKKYLPYVPSLATSGSYRSDALSSGQPAFYNAPPTGVVQIPTSTQVAYAETRVEASPLGRILEQGAPGLSWKIGGGHTKTTAYAVNTSADAVKLWTVNSSGSGASYSTNYSPGMLNVTTITDEDGNSILVFKDIDGKTVSRKSQSGSGTYVMTDYVYDDLGNLRYVIPPLPNAYGANSAVAVPTSFTESNAIFLNYFYAYHYDDLARLVEKKMPGQDWQYMVYNSKDQAILSQDGNQRNMGIWMITKYDIFGRTIMTGKMTSSSSRSSLQSSADASSSNIFESFNNSTTNFGYSHTSYPDITAAGCKVLTVYYYDSYDFLNNTAINPGLSIFQPPSTTIDSLDQAPRGLLEGSLINVLGTNNYVFSNYIYNKNGKLVKTVAQNYQGGSLSYNKYDTEENQYSFQNNVTQTTHKHYLPSSNSPQVLILTSLSFDHMNRQILQKQQYNTLALTGTPVNIFKIDYNEIGQSITKHLHSVSAGMPANSSFLQHIDYRYNSRGWLNRINNSGNTVDENFASQFDVFSENLDYDQSSNGLGGTGKYNGNLSSVKWQTKWPAVITLTQQYKGYVFTYDVLNRLTRADYKSQTASENTSYDEIVTYDEPGNILSLIRKNGVSTILDNMVYNYMNGTARSNRLMSIGDPGAVGSENFVTSYGYDSNGNLLTDTRKTITSMVYNELNLPVQITISSGSKVIKNVYDAAGKKLERIITAAGVTSEDRFYVDGIEYKSSAIDLIRTTDGRATPTGASGSYVFEYNIVDHLGNVRAVIGDKDNNGSLSTSEILQVCDYYPFGREITYSQGSPVPNPDNNYKFNGKEYQKDFNEYDFGARFYDPLVARWMTIDPMTETSRRWSPYVYTQDNPVRYIDPDGMKTQNPDGSFTENGIGEDIFDDSDKRLAEQNHLAAVNNAINAINNSINTQTPISSVQAVAATPETKDKQKQENRPYIIENGKKVYIDQIKKGGRSMIGVTIETDVKTVNNDQIYAFLKEWESGYGEASIEIAREGIPAGAAGSILSGLLKASTTKSTIAGVLLAVFYEVGSENMGRIAGQFEDASAAYRDAHLSNGLIVIMHSSSVDLGHSASVETVNFELYIPNGRLFRKFTYTQ